MKNNVRKIVSGKDRTLFVVAVILTMVGVVAVADASAPNAIREFSDKYYYARQQLFWGIFGIVAMIIASNIHYSLWERLANYLFILGIFLLIAVLLPGVGTKIYGARRWLDLGFFSFQPSEFIKLSLAIYLAKVTAKQKQLNAYIIPLCIVVILVMLQPDLGTTLVITAIGITQIFISGINIMRFVAISVAGIVLAFIFTIFSEYRRARLMTFFTQTSDPLGKSYHVRQILLALGSGGLFGVGLGESRQKYLFLPETATDSIFAVIAEEIGFLGSSVILFLLLFLLYRILRIALNAPDDFSRVLTLGVLSWIGMQILLNLGSMVVLVPLTGVPLPFFSKGGTALAMILFALGIVLNISEHAKAK